MFNEIRHIMEEQLSNGKNFAIAQIIGRISPSSSKIGDKAIILESGQLIGWIGGGCVRGIVIKEALDVIQTKKFIKIRVSPEGGTKEKSNFKEYIMSCQSKGTVEIMIESVIAQPEIVIIGKSNIARKLAKIATESDFKVSVLANNIAPEMFPSVNFISEKIDFKSFSNLNNSYIIVTTQGDDDEISVLKAMQTTAQFIGFVSSRKKTNDIKDYLKNNGVNKNRIAQLRSPIGLDINAKLASEVSISILAEVIQHFRSGKPIQSEDYSVSKKDSESNTISSTFQDEFFINPVCNVPVSKTNPKHIIEYEGEKVFFCCDGCKNTFEKNPTQYISNKKQ